MQYKSTQIIICVFLSIICNVRTFAESTKLSPSDIYIQKENSILTLIVTHPDGSINIGTAFVAIDETIAITAAHVVKDAVSIVARAKDGEVFNVVGVFDFDEKKDVALIQVNAYGREPLRCISKQPNTGAVVYTIGAPKGLEFSLSNGILSRVVVEDGLKLYQFTTPISPGNSGGPLIDDNGNVIGVIVSQLVEGQNLNFRIPIGYALALKRDRLDIVYDNSRTNDTNIENNKKQNLHPATEDKLQINICKRLSPDIFTCEYYKDADLSKITNKDNEVALAYVRKHEDISRLVLQRIFVVQDKYKELQNQLQLYRIIAKLNNENNAAKFAIDDEGDLIIQSHATYFAASNNKNIEDIFNWFYFTSIYIARYQLSDYLK